MSYLSLATNKSLACARHRQVSTVLHIQLSIKLKVLAVMSVMTTLLVWPASARSADGLCQP